MTKPIPSRELDDRQAMRRLFPREVVRYAKALSICQTCQKGSLVSERLTMADPPLISPQGRVHHGADGGMTACGKDATGPGWWWRL